MLKMETQKLYGVYVEAVVIVTILQISRGEFDYFRLQ